MATADSGVLRVGILGPGPESVQWARVLEYIGADFWYFSPQGEDISEVLEQAPSADIENSIPYFVDGYTDFVICASEASDSREDYMLEALENGVAVLCEPPLALTAEEADTLYETAKKNETGLMTTFHALHTASYRQMHHWSHKKIGDIKYIEVQWMTPEWNKDPLWDVSPEAIAMIQGFPIPEPGSFRSEDGPGWLNVSFVHPNVTINVSAVSGAARLTRNIKMIGDKGAIECNPFQEEVILMDETGEQTTDLSTGVGPRRNILMFFARRLKENKEKGTELPYGEIGMSVSSILGQLDRIISM